MRRGSWGVLVAVLALGSLGCPDHPVNLVDARQDLQQRDQPRMETGRTDRWPDLRWPDLLPRDFGVVPGTWVTIQPGTFSMGSPTTELCRFAEGETQHQVTLTRRFEIQATEVTQQQFTNVMGYNPSSNKAAPRPVDSATWHEAAAHCNELSRRAGLQACYTNADAGKACTSVAACSFGGVCVGGKCLSFTVEPAFADQRLGTGSSKIYLCPGYRLPTEAEWEYAYRAGTGQATYAGPLGSCKGQDSVADVIAWYASNSGSSSQPVGTKKANPWQLFDMAGNLAEMVHDWYLDDLGSQAVTNPCSSGKDPPALSTNCAMLCRTRRNGGFAHTPEALRAAARGPMEADESNSLTGFRCARSLPQ